MPRRALRDEVHQRPLRRGHWRRVHERRRGVQAITIRAERCGGGAVPVRLLFGPSQTEYIASEDGGIREECQRDRTVLGAPRGCDEGGIYFPGLKSHPQHDIASRQQHGHGAMITFYCVGGREQSDIVLRYLRVFALAESLGGGGIPRGMPEPDDPRRLRAGRPARAAGDRRHADTAVGRDRELLGSDRRFGLRAERRTEESILGWGVEFRFRGLLSPMGDEGGGDVSESSDSV